MERPAISFETKLTEAVLSKKIILNHTDKEILQEYFQEIYCAYKRNKNYKDFLIRKTVSMPENSNLQKILSGIKNQILEQEELMDYLIDKI
jgi:hypothetical protein